MNEARHQTIVAFMLCLMYCLYTWHPVEATDLKEIAQKTLQDKLSSLDDSKISVASLQSSIESTTKDLKAQRTTLKNKIHDTNQESQRAVLALQTTIAQKIKDVNDARKTFEKNLNSSVDQEQAKPLLKQVDQTVSEHEKAATALSSLETVKEIAD